MINIDLTETDLIRAARGARQVHVAFESATSLADSASLVSGVEVHRRFSQMWWIEVLFGSVELGHESAFGYL